MNLYVKCPNCMNEVVLGEESADIYKSKRPFTFNKKCGKCGCRFTEDDTSESGYSIK